MALPSAILLAAILASALSLAGARVGIGSVRTRYFGAPRGREGPGVRYAFTTAFLPWVKESARGHLASYLAGVCYHAGIFAMLASLVLSLASLAPPAPVAVALAVVFVAALACGLGLLAKRSVDPGLRALSVPDDFLSNLLVDAALATALAAALEPRALPLFQLSGAALLLYAPLGKLRHMLFLLTSRRLWGATYGRRGVLP